MNVYVAATRQNDGKTIVSVGLIAALIKRLSKVGYIKPVGQHFIDVETCKIDEDSILMKQVFDIDCELPDMSPIAIPRGFTEAYIENPDRNRLVERITAAYTKCAQGKDFVLIEGTGHAGVGSVFDMSNAEVAQLLGAKVILVSAGGVGRPIDEVMLNKALFDSRGVDILGVIVNKIQPDKYEKIAPIVTKGLARKGLDVLGVMPYVPILSSPTIGQLLEETNGDLLSGDGGLSTIVNRTIVGAMAPHQALEYFDKGTLLITPGSRDDLILAAITSYAIDTDDKASVAGLVLTGRDLPNKKVMDLVKRANVPVIGLKDDTFTAATKISSLMVKLRSGDREKIFATENLVSEYVNIDRILDKLAG